MLLLGLSHIGVALHGEEDIVHVSRGNSGCRPSLCDERGNPKESAGRENVRIQVALGLFVITGYNV